MKKIRIIKEQINIVEQQMHDLDDKILDIKSFMQFARTVVRLRIGDEVFWSQAREIYESSAMRFHNILLDLNQQLDQERRLDNATK